MYQHTSKRDLLNFFTRQKGEEAPQNKKQWNPIPKFKGPNNKGAKIVLGIFIVLFITLTYLLF